LFNSSRKWEWHSLALQDGGGMIVVVNWRVTCHVFGFGTRRDGLDLTLLSKDGLPIYCFVRVRSILNIFCFVVVLGREGLNIWQARPTCRFMSLSSSFPSPLSLLPVVYVLPALLPRDLTLLCTRAAHCCCSNALCGRGHRSFVHHAAMHRSHSSMCRRDEYEVGSPGFSVLKG
jgi:hypothetical protein